MFLNTLNHVSYGKFRGNTRVALLSPACYFYILSNSPSYSPQRCLFVWIFVTNGAFLLARYIFDVWVDWRMPDMEFWFGVSEFTIFHFNLNQNLQSHVLICKCAYFYPQIIKSVKSLDTEQCLNSEESALFSSIIQNIKCSFLFDSAKISKQKHLRLVG